MDRPDVAGGSAVGGKALAYPPAPPETAAAPATGSPPTAEIRAWARATGIVVPDRGRLRPDIWQTWRGAHP